MMLREWIAALVEGGLGASRVRNAHDVLVEVLGSAVEARRLTVNVAANMRGLPRRPELEMHFLTTVENRGSIALARRSTSTAVGTGAYTGLRLGELIGLKVKRLDLLRGTVPGAEALSEVDGRLVWAHRRTTSVARSACPASWPGNWAPGSPAGRTVLMTSCSPRRGGPIREHKLLERYFKPAVERAGLPPSLCMHDLRHAATSLLIRGGAIRDEYTGATFGPFSAFCCSLGHSRE